MKKLYLILLAACSAFAQTNYPGSIDTNENLKVLINGVQTVLSGSLSSGASTASVASCTGIAANTLATINTVTLSNNEIVAVLSCSGTTVTFDTASPGCTSGRGCDGTSALTHAQGELFSLYFEAYHGNVDKSAIKAIETSIGPNFKQPYVIASTYNFSPQTPGGSLSAGSQTITLAPCPFGVAGADSNHYLEVSGGTGTAEAAIITGGTCTSGAASGTVVLTIANSHSGAWTVSSANAGNQEALNACGGPCTVFNTAGDTTWHGPVTTPPITTTTAHAYGVIGAGRQISRINIASDFPTSVTCILCAGYDGTHFLNGPDIENIGIILSQPYSSNISGFTHWPTVIYSDGPIGGQIKNVYISGAWNGIYLNGENGAGGQWVIDDVEMSAFNIGIDVLNSPDITRISKFHFWPYTDNTAATTTTQSQMFNPSVIGIYADTDAGITLSDSFMICGVAMVLNNSVDFVTVDNTSFDVFGVIKVGQNGGSRLTLTNSYVYQVPNFGSYNCSQPAFQIGNSAGGGSQVMMNNLLVTRSCATQPFLQVEGPSVYATISSSFTLTNSAITDTSNTAGVPSLIQIVGNGAIYDVDISHNQIGYSYNLSYTNPMLAVSGTGPILTSVGIVNDGEGSGTWISVGTNAKHLIIGDPNSPNGSGWNNVLPSVPLTGVFQDATFTYPRPTPIVDIVFSQSPYAVDVLGNVGAVMCNATSGNVSVVLPPVAAAPGAIYLVKKTDSSGNSCGFTPNSSDKIDGASSKSTSTQYGWYQIQGDGTTWNVIGVH